MTDSSAHSLAAAHLALGYRDRRIIDGLDVEIPAGAITAIVGPNACGKSTLLRGLSRLLAPAEGKVLLDGKDIHSMHTREVATVLGLLPQAPQAPDGISVADLVGRGRYPHQGWFRKWSTEDDEIVHAAMEATSVVSLAARNVDELSGGQRQRVWIAMALAQRAEVLLLDEPTTYLDITHQIEVLDLLVDVNKDSGATIVMVLHDLNLASRYADHLIAMCDGRIVAQGAPTDIVTADLVREVFDLDSVVLPDPVGGTPTVSAIGRHHRLSP
ncbi:iron complex transport system ATP-binding protein [Microbacterium halimionae]|uniref:Iron complex transport system ATP-binding protein n=1 Tax=Microbacterium halimionae TaxID=1526413 RepID=A0A7W3PM80_9MICO|nr:ABC transporter ATP-binding protein [Microbacterium halimionae]MBA8816806.1 iron complex transport system ATP-binding protein [Microbacterium halimionae]NII94898.1 iron complex transport system ATP-binding protein [Microbacterium halimionae]